MKSLNAKTVDAAITALEREKNAITEKINKKTKDYDAKVAEKRKQFLTANIEPLQNKIVQIKKEIAKHQKIKSLLQEESKENNNA